MKDYASMSDFEINKLVAIANGYPHDDCDIAKLNNPMVGVEWDDDTDYATKTLDYCNNPADAWSIIVQGGISLIKCTVGSGCWSAEIITDIDEATDNLFQCQSSFDYQDANPLRAAMIVFLKMKEVEND